MIGAIIRYSRLYSSNRFQKMYNTVIFSGMGIGDGLCDPISMTNYGDYLYEVGMIGYKERRHFQEMEKGARENIQQGNWRIAGEANYLSAISVSGLSLFTLCCLSFPVSRSSTDCWTGTSTDLPTSKTLQDRRTTSIFCSSRNRRSLSSTQSF